MEQGTSRDFRTRQAIFDLRYAARQFSGAVAARIAAGLGIRGDAGRDPARRILFFFQGKVPTLALADDPSVRSALMLASALPDDDFDASLAATTLLLLERLECGTRVDNLFWSRRTLIDHWRLAEAPLRAAIFCGLREANRLGVVSLSIGATAEDHLSQDAATVLTALERPRIAAAAPDLFATVSRLLAEPHDPVVAGRQWSLSARQVLALPNGARGAASAGFRHLYERPGSIEVPDPGAPTIPPLD